MRAKTKHVLLGGLMFAAAVASSTTLAKSIVVQLAGKHEVPAVVTQATGQGTIVVNNDRSVGGSIATTGVAGTVAHIHVGAEGTNGPVAIPLGRSGEGGWSVPDNAKLTEEQYRRFQMGELYVNVHSAAHPDGEIRGQLKP